VELSEITKLAHSYGVMTIVDAVTTLSTMPFYMDEWKIDAVITGGQKGLSCVPGISLIAFSERAFDFILKREALMPHWCLDPRRAFQFWGKHEYHYTAPVSGVMALYEALRLICKETLEKRFDRHFLHSEVLQRSLEVMGFEFYAPKACRLNSVLAVKNFEGVDVKELLRVMRKTHGVEISGAFGLNIFRIGQMGEQCRPHNARRLIEAIGLTHQSLGINVAMKEALQTFDQGICPLTTYQFVS